MVHDCALCSDTTGSWARVSALLVGAGLVKRTLGADDTLRSTRWRRPDVARHTGTDSLAVDLPALAVGAAGRGVAGVGDRGRGYGPALDEGVARHALRAAADGHMVHHAAEGVSAAGARARFLALVPDAGLVPGAVRAQHTLWPAASVRVTLVLGQARAHSVSALGVGAAGRGVAGVGLHGLSLRWRLRVAAGERIPSVAVRTGAHRCMVDDRAVGVEAARARARVLALLPDARQVAGALGVDHALRSAVGRRAEVIRQAGAGRVSTDVSALRVGSAG